MDIKTLIEQAHKNAYNKGFYDMELRVLRKMKMLEFDAEEIEAIENAFITQKLALIVCEVAEAIEALRKKNIENFKEEVADIVIRIGDLSGAYGIELEQFIQLKMEKNKNRPRLHGKSF